MILGVGLGFAGSRVTRSSNKPEVSTPSLPKEATRHNIEPVKEELKSPQQEIQPAKEELKPLKEEIQPAKEELKPLKEEIQPAKEELKPLQEGIEPLKEELKQTQLAYEMARQMSQFKGGFLGRTAHELRSPLSSMMGLHQLILNDLCDSPEEAREFVAQANAKASEMVKLLDEVIGVSKIEHGSIHLETYALPLAQVFEDVYRLTHLQAANSNLQFEVVPPDPEIQVLADPRRFRQVLVGIVDTAIAHLSERKEGSLKVQAARSPESDEVRIWIDVEAPTSLWSEAVDLLSTTPETEKQPDKTAALSPGLSLLMAQSLVEVMQGRLEVLPLSSEGTAASSTTETTTRLQCTMPLAIPETVEQVLA